METQRKDVKNLLYTAEDYCHNSQENFKSLRSAHCCSFHSMILIEKNNESVVVVLADTII